ncbi:MAG: hypothetical protein ABEK12_00330, partial [Candidatus Nanohaloarchaea archaeon]
THIDHDPVVAGHDVRISSPDLLAAFSDGVVATGVDVLDAGHVPYGPVLAAGRARDLPTAYVTASHLDREWNGIKFSDAAGRGYPEEANMAVEDLFHAREFAAGDGDRRATGVIEAYRDGLLDRVDIDDVDVLMDCG